MRNIIIAAFISFFLLATAIPAISKDFNKDTHGRRDQKERPAKPPRPDYKNRPDYYNQRGYREHPYDKRLHYGHYDYKGHGYAYRGHWMSWKQWEAYRRTHPNLYKHGTYYRENAHLMFRFCEPGTGNCFFFSIGR